jgi:hypothetical protein
VRGNLHIPTEKSRDHDWTCTNTRITDIFDRFCAPWGDKRIGDLGFAFPLSRALVRIWVVLEKIRSAGAKELQPHRPPFIIIRGTPITVKIPLSCTSTENRASTRCPAQGIEMPALHCPQTSASDEKADFGPDLTTRYLASCEVSRTARTDRSSLGGFFLRCHLVRGLANEKLADI